MLIYVSDNKIHKVIHLEPTEGTVYPKKDMTNDTLYSPISIGSFPGALYQDMIFLNLNIGLLHSNSVTIFINS